MRFETLKFFCRQILFFVVLSIFAVAITGCNSDSKSDPKPSVIDYDDPALESRLDQALSSWAETFGDVGAAAMVYSPHPFEWRGAVGLKNIADQTPYTVTTKGRIGSATKPMTATVILELVEEGLLTLDTPMSTFFPDYPNGDTITIEHLLRHRSGIPELQLDDMSFILYILKHQTQWMSPEEILSWTYGEQPIISISHNNTAIPRGPVSEPGAEFHYSQPGFIALGSIIEKVTGKSLADVFAERIFIPLGMENTHLPRIDENMEPIGYTNLYGINPTKIAYSEFLISMNGVNSAMWSAGGVVTTVDDLVKFLRGLVTGQLISEDTFDHDMTDFMPSTFNGYDPTTTLDYGMGFIHYKRPDYDSIGHNGGIPGGGSIMQYIPDLDVYIIAIRNSDEDELETYAPHFFERMKNALLNQPSN